MSLCHISCNGAWEQNAISEKHEPVGHGPHFLTYWPSDIWDINKIDQSQIWPYFYS